MLLWGVIWRWEDYIRMGILVGVNTETPNRVIWGGSWIVWSEHIVSGVYFCTEYNIRNTIYIFAH